MKIIDPHVHIWKSDPKFPWASETKNPPQEDATPEMLLKLMNENNVEKTVLVQVIHYRWDNSYVAHAVKTYPGKFMAVGRINPEDPDAPDHLSCWTEEHGLHGVRLSPSVDASGDWFAGPLMDPIFGRAEQLGVPMLILTRSERLRDLADILDRHGDLDVVIDHMADCSPDQPEKLELLLNLASFPRVYVKISHTWSISKTDYPWTDTHDMVKKIYHTFGGNRIMWSTDWPVCLSKASYGQALTVVKNEMDFFTLEDREWMLGKTALRIWRFDD
ncbi:MAG: amidohydrolase [SAR202 cluster bacterium]|nr:amidohydrolase [SAR202 cluster bacterium]